MNKTDEPMDEKPVIERRDKIALAIAEKFTR